MTAKEYLKQVEKIDLMIKNKLIEREQALALALSVTSHLTPDKVQSSSSQQKMAEAVERYVSLETEIDNCIDELFDTKKEIISKIEKLEARYYDILHKVYIQYLEYKDIAKQCDRSYSWVSMMHDKALQQFEEMFISEIVKSCEKL